jgi:hypothetical protein
MDKRKWKQLNKGIVPCFTIATITIPRPTEAETKAIETSNLPKPSKSLYIITFAANFR